MTQPDKLSRAPTEPKLKFWLNDVAYYAKWPEGISESKVDEDVKLILQRNKQSVSQEQMDAWTDKSDIPLNTCDYYTKNPENK